MDVRGVTYAQLAELCKNKSNKSARNLYAKIRGDRKLSVEDGVDIFNSLEAPEREIDKFAHEWAAQLEHLQLKKLNPSKEAISRFKPKK